MNSRPQRPGRGIGRPPAARCRPARSARSRLPARVCISSASLIQSSIDPKSRAAAYYIMVTSVYGGGNLAGTFISYAKKDRERVVKIVQLLKEAGIDSVWIDFENLKPGKNFDDEIEAALTTATCVVGCWSKNAKSSEFARDEMRRANRMGKLIPVRLDELEPMIGLGNLQYVDLVAWDYLSGSHPSIVALIASVRTRISEKNESTNGVGGEKATLQDVADYLMRELDYIDTDSNYDNAWFTPLEAQVRVRQATGDDDQNICDLLSALEDPTSSKVVLVLGLPGSGKSVAMREFTRHGLAKVARTNVLPIYINLRDWLPDRRWTLENPPRIDDLERFIKSCLTFENNPAVTAFLTDYRQLHADGRIHWIFDSFDELPAILDASVGPTAQLIRSVSKLLDDFVRVGSGEGRRSARGVVASRFERKPQLPSRLVTQLEIQPFSDNRIRDTFMRIDGFHKGLVDDIFRPPGDLVPIARTPFYHGLIAEYAIATGSLPKTTVQLFEAYVLRRLAAAIGIEPALVPSDRRLQETIRVAAEVAHFLFSSEQYGLGAPFSALMQTFPDIDLNNYLSYLKRAKIIRRGPAPGEMITFSHRRMHEYFVIRYKTRVGIPFDLEWVARDARERDSAVLYVELTDSEMAQNIALSLWQEVQKGENLDYSEPQFFRALHCQRFLVDAFRTRRPAIDSFRDELEGMVTRRLTENEDIISIKLAVETLGLLSEHGLERNIRAALRRGDFWIRETAIDACRFLPSVSLSVVGHIWRCIAFMPQTDFLRELDRLRFSFRLSPSLQQVSDRIEERATDIQRWNQVGWWILAILRHASVPIAYLRSKFSTTAPHNWKHAKTKFQDSPISLYVSDWQVLATHNFETGSGIVTFEEWLKYINRDRRFGLGLYRARLTESGLHLLSNATLSVILYLSLGPYTGASIPESPEFISLWAAVTALTLFVGLKWQRSYDLTVEGELIRPVTNVTRVVAFIGQVAAVTLGLGFWVLLCFVLVVCYYLFKGLPSGKSLIGHGFDSTILVIVWLFAAGMVISACVAMGTFVYGVISRLRERRRLTRDRKLFKKICAVGQRSRPQIANSFASFETSRWREEYVDWLVTQRIEPSDEWPSGRPPNLQDPASTKLARLEHRWRGFEK